MPPRVVVVIARSALALALDLDLANDVIDLEVMLKEKLLGFSKCE